METILMTNNPKSIIQNLPLIVITGPTASGKTSLAIDVALQHGGEIICADSRTIYKYMDIGTAKPTAAERAKVPHFGLDLIEPDVTFSASDFKSYADQKIIEIRGRGHVPILVGGTGLYVDAVVFNYQFGPPADVALRSELQRMTLAELHTYCDNHNVTMPENKLNKRYVIRAIETANSVPIRSLTPVKNTIIVGIATDKVILRQRIAARSEQLFDDGVVDEAKRLGEIYGWDTQAMTSNIYRVVHELLLGTMTTAESKAKNEVLDWRLAKRQITWLKRNHFIHWTALEHAGGYISDQLAKSA
jgi:tRNA dimethylallyltransferase